jgi:phosphoribosylglycinamide formyltransferase-1
MAIQEHIAKGSLNAKISVVISNRKEAPGLAWAKSEGLSSYFVNRKTFPTKDQFEAKIDQLLGDAGVDLIVMAGYMALLGKTFVNKNSGRIINIHPALLPAFPGLNAQGQALAAGVKVTGLTVHFVDEGLDSGPIILQQAVPVLDGDSVESLSERILKEEHQHYATAIQLFADGRLKIGKNKVAISNN